ncbi:MAG: hypothetical protein JW881_21145, partial [Spirochaetales bacterium]|nr:hypothetical protein [Spirochaetales bacterium]
SNRSTTTSIASGGGSSSGSCPSSLTCPGNASCGCYSVSGLGANKRALTNAGASQYMIAAAMMETEKMDTNYSYCDGKSGDSCCCGVTKANWYESRTAGAGYSDYRSFCDAVNGSRSADVSNWNRLRSYWGSKYWAVHRNGESGNTNPNTADIQRFKEANDWTDSHIGGHLSDDIRFWVDVPAI